MQLPDKKLSSVIYTMEDGKQYACKDVDNFVKNISLSNTLGIGNGFNFEDVEWVEIK